MVLYKEKATERFPCIHHIISSYIFHLTMDSDTEIIHDFFPMIRVYKDGKTERFIGNKIVPPSVNDPATSVQSKDVNILQENGVSARVYISKSANPTHKLPLLVYFHGGGFVAESAFSSTYQNYLNMLVAESNIIAVSVDYRKAPEHPLPIAYEDSWTAVKWVISHSSGLGQEPWINEYADFERVFFAGDSAGANIAHNMAMRVGLGYLHGVSSIEGIILVHAYFWGKNVIGGEGADMGFREYLDKLWFFVYPVTSGLDDPLLEPGLDPELCRLGCKRVLVCNAEKDPVRDRGWYYKEVLEKSGWGGKVEVMEVKGEGHVFHLLNPTSDNAVVLLKAMASFMNQDKP